MAVEATLSPTQAPGVRPPGLQQALRQHPEWERLQCAIFGGAMGFQSQLVFDFRELLTNGAVLASGTKVGDGRWVDEAHGVVLTIADDGGKLMLLARRKRTSGGNLPSLGRLRFLQITIN